MSQIKVAELDELVKKYADTLAVLDEISARTTVINKELATVKLQIAGYLRELNRESYSSPHGEVVADIKWSVKMPASPEAKALLWGWMREKEIYDAYATVHATALKSLFMKERELALERGEDPITFALPGLEPATCFEDIKLKKPKK